MHGIMEARTVNVVYMLPNTICNSSNVGEPGDPRTEPANSLMNSK